MKKMLFVIFMSALTLLTAMNAFGQYNTTYCGSSNGKGITYTSARPWDPNNANHGLIGSKHNDTYRLNEILTNCQGKIIFDELEYYINDTLPIYPFRLLEGSGTGALTDSITINNYPYAVYPSSKIIQMANKPIFKIGPNITDVAIRDMALIGGLPLREQGVDVNTNMHGIFAEGGKNSSGQQSTVCNSNDVSNCSSFNFQFSNLKFLNLNKGIYVNGFNNGEWQIDNVRLDHAFFVGCIMGVHINSWNSGWNISGLDFIIPEGVTQGTNESTTGKTYGVYLERSTYTSMDLLIGNGPSSTGPALATALIYVKGHGNLSIQSTVAEGFHEDIVIDGFDLNSPINLMNNTFLNGVRVKRATLYSSSNQYSAFNSNGAPAIATDFSQIYSYGDKYCAEGNTLCDEGRGFTTSGNARVIYSTNQSKNTTSVPTFHKSYSDISWDNYTLANTPLLSVTVPNYTISPLLRLGVRNLNYDFTRNETDGFLEIKGNQNNYSGYKFQMSEDTNNDQTTDKINSVTINNNGSVTLGSVVFSSLYSAGNGTLIYCSNCQKTTPCTTGGNGALAKRINGSWDCD